MASFADNLGSIVSATYVGFALSLSKDVGILETLLDSQTPLTSQEIADMRDLKERYVRELLASLATAEVVHVSTNESGALVYHLDEDEKNLLRTQVMAFLSGPLLMSPVYDAIKSCVKITGPYGARLSHQAHDFIETYTSYHLDEYVDSILKCVDGLKENLERGIDVLEVGCGRGRLLAKLALMFPKSTFTASDDADFLLDHWKANLGYIPNIKCAIVDVCSSDTVLMKQYDWVYCTNALHEMPNPTEALKNIKACIKDRCGTFTMIDIATSGSPIADKGNMLVACMYAISACFCVPESYTKEGSLVLGMCYGKPRAMDFVTAAGFQVNVVDLEYPITLYVCK